MGQITAIKPQRRQSRFNIFIDGVFSFGIDANVFLKEGLKTGLNVTNDDVARIVKENEFANIYNKALKFLSFRPRSEGEFKEWFRKKEIGEDVQKLVISKLKELKFINDEEFAKWWIEQRTTIKPRALRVIKFELKQKGISSEIIEDQISKINPDQIGIKDQKQDDLDMAKEIVRKKIHKYKGLSRQEIFNKLGGFLARRGFSYDVIKQSIDEITSKIV